MSDTTENPLLPEEQSDAPGTEAFVPAEPPAPAAEPAGAEVTETAAGPETDGDVPAEPAAAEAPAEGVPAAAEVSLLDAAALAAAKAWCTIDEHGHIHLKDGEYSRKREVGRVDGNEAAVFSQLADRFARFSERFAKLKLELEKSNSKWLFISRVEKMAEEVRDLKAVGDFDSLINDIDNTADRLRETLAQAKKKKEELCAKAEELQNSVEWKKTATLLQQMMEAWKAAGSIGREADEALWKRFRAANDVFYKRRGEHYDQLREGREANRARKEELCVQAEALCTSEDWKETSDALKALMDEWKKAGSAGLEHEDQLWARFRKSMDFFYERKNAFYSEHDQALVGNLEKKEALAAEAESIVAMENPLPFINRIREMQELWRTIGPAPRSKSDEVWERFRSSCQKVFTIAKDERKRRRQEWKDKQDEWKQKMGEALDRKREQAVKLQESISFSDGNITKLKARRDELALDGNPVSEIEVRIADEEEKLRVKSERLAELQKSIAEIEAKL